MPMLFINILVVTFMVVAIGILSAIETAIAASIASNIIKNNPHLSQKKIQKIKSLLAQKEQIITAILISFTVLATIATTIITSSLMDVYGKDRGQTIASMIMSVVLVVFSEIIPKIVAVSNSEVIILRTTHIMRILLIIFWPANVVFEYITPAINKIFRLSSSNK